MPSSSRVCAITGDEERQPEDEEHRVGVDEIVEAVERQDSAARSQRAPAAAGEFDVPRRGAQARRTSRR